MSSHATTGSSDSHLRACRAEIEELKGTLHELALRDAGSGTPGFTEVLESKYLAQIKKSRTLSVQLGTTQQQLVEAQRALQNEKEKTSRLVAAATSMGVAGASLSSGAEQKRRGSAGRQRPAPRRSPGGKGSEEHDGNEEESGEKDENATVAMQRVYAQLHQRDMALAEAQRENVALRGLVKSEVGLKDEAAEVDALLKRTAESAGGGAPGWRGRAEELVLLRSRLKDAQRRAETMAAAAEEDGEGNPLCDRDGGERTDSLGLPASVRAYLGMGDASPSETRSINTTTTTTTTTAARRRDVDDDARDRLTSLQQQRAAQQRQAAVVAEQQQRQLQEEKLRTAALQARVATLKTELETLRAYVETILDKSSTDDELVEAYRAELQQAQAATRQWQKAAADATTQSNNSNRGGGVGKQAVGGVRTNEGAIVAAAAAAAAVRSAPYRKDAPQHSPTGSPAPPPTSSSSSSGAVAPSQQALAALPKAEATAYAWVLQAFAETPSVQGVNNSSTAAAAPAAAAMAAVLRTAMQHVAQVERQSADTAAAALLDTAAVEGVEKVLVMENTQLKKRIRALTDMMERETQAQHVLWKSREGVQ